MKKWLCLLLAGVLTFSLAACHREQNSATLPTESTGAKQANNTGATQPDNTEVTRPNNTEETQPTDTEATQSDDTEETKPDDKETEESPYAIREVTDNRVKVEGGQKIYDDSSFFSLSFPADWKCLEQQGEDGRNHFFRDPILNENCQLSIRLTGAVYAKERTQDEYLKLLSYSYKNVVIDSITKETIQGLQGTKVVYSHTKDGVNYIGIYYNNCIDGVRLFDIWVNYPADQKDTYESILAAIVDSIVFNQAK